jgi:hypothetical protein
MLFLNSGEDFHLLFFLLVRGNKERAHVLKNEIKTGLGQTNSGILLIMALSHTLMTDKLYECEVNIVSSGCSFKVLMGLEILFLMRHTLYSEKFHFLFFYSIIHMCIHYLSHFFPLPHALFLFPNTPLASRQNLFCPYLILLKKKT